MKYVESITVCPSNKTIRIGTWYHGATATVCPSDADKTSVCWYSEDDNIASVNPTMGYIYGISLGTTRIYAQACDGSGVKGYMTVTVAQTVPVENITLSHSRLSIEKDTQISLTASIYPEDATNKSLTWCSSNESVARVANGVVCGIGKGTATIIATTTNGKSVSCTVTVTNGILVSSITVNPSEKIMTVGDSAFLSSTVYPSNATKKSVCWRSDNPNVVTVNENSGLIVAQNPGTARIYATACDGGGAQGYCEVTVEEPIKVECVCVYPQKMTIAPDEEEFIIASISPIWATNTSVTWKSSNPNVATVEKRTPANNMKGNLAAIIGKSKGTATITATATDGSNKKSSCTVTVDPREKVTVKKDSHSFYVKFADGKIWKGIGIDLSNRQDNYAAIYPPDFDYENYDDLIEEEQRYFDNIYVEKDGKMENNTYTEKQIGFLYLLDPFGIEYYMRNHACKYMNLGEELFFKDRVYKEIFGVWPRLIKVFPNKTIQYYVYSTTISAEARADYYTDAEILFGEHPIYDLLSFISFLLDVVPGVSLSLFSMFYPPVGVVLGSIDLVKFLFFSASASGVLSSGANSIMEEYTSYVYTLSNGESAGVKAGKAMGWVNFIMGTFSTILDAAEVFAPSINDITIYNQVSKSDYQVNYNVSGSELSMEDIIARIS